MVTVTLTVTLALVTFDLSYPTNPAIVKTMTPLSSPCEPS